MCKMGLYFKFFYSILYHTSNSVFGTMKCGQKCETRIRTIRKRQKKWIGHMLRGDSLLRTVIKEKKLMEENRRKRHRRRLVKNIGWAKPK